MKTSCDIESTVLSRMMTLPEAAETLGMRGNRRAAAARLERYIRRREKVANAAILIDVGTPRLPRFRITLARLRDYCPELFDTRVEMTELLRTHVEGIEERLCRIERNEEALAGEIEEIAARVSDA
jgi:hypothetical protein